MDATFDYCEVKHRKFKSLISEIRDFFLENGLVTSFETLFY